MRRSLQENTTGRRISQCNEHQLNPCAKVVCCWTRDEEGSDRWQTSCRKYFILIDEETPTECGFKFCPFCGDMLKVCS